MRPVGSKYLLEEPLGRGATGTVWRARQRETAGSEAAVAGEPGETVAIKVLKEELANDPDVVMRFLRERSVLLRLTHENIVRTRDLVVEGDLLALVMDLVEGQDLHEYLRANGPFTPVAAALLTAQIADALAASHSDGVVHRDLKPANVLLTEGGQGMRPMLTDFGIARLADSPGLTRTSEFVGTPSYVAPESAEGRPQTSAVDVYGAGVLLYELLTGQPPFSGDTSLEVLQRHLSEEPQRPPGLPDPIWTVVERCLRKNPADRPSAVSLAQALRTVAGGIGANATPDQARAALGVAGLMAPDPQPAAVPDGQLSGADDATQALSSTGQGGPVGGANADPNAATNVLPQTGAPDGSPAGPDADPTRAMPPVPGSSPQQPPDQPDGPHPWQNQLRAARDRNEQTQVQPLDPNHDPLRRRPQRQSPPPPQPYQQPPQPYQQPPPGPYQQAPPPQQQYGPQGYGPQHPPAPQQQRRPESRQRPRREPREPREPRRSNPNRMRIPGLGCLKGCLFMILILVVIAVLVWNFTPVPEWWAEGKSFWEQTKDFFGSVRDFFDSIGGGGEGG